MHASSHLFDIGIGADAMESLRESEVHQRLVASDAGNCIRRRSMTFFRVGHIGREMSEGQRNKFGPFRDLAVARV